jgi:hypothetical protein
MEQFRLVFGEVCLCFIFGTMRFAGPFFHDISLTTQHAIEEKHRSRYIKTDGEKVKLL